MKLFQCVSDGQLLDFANTQCLGCNRALGYLPEFNALSPLEPVDGDVWRALVPTAQGVLYKKCANYAEHQVCNWMTPADSGHTLCTACRHNQVIPNLAITGNLEQWAQLEAAKRRLFYTLFNLNLPLITKLDDPERGLAFAFLDDDPTLSDSDRAITGHADGLITIHLAEADPAERERTRQQLAEPYRTLLGHFRHEIGHYYWDLLVRDDSTRLASYRALFGDERQDYQQALQRHYAQGPTADWPQWHISAYASSHPWEDWAETWAHYLHMSDTLETARAVGLAVNLRHNAQQRSEDPAATLFDRLIDDWFELTFAVNNINRSMGLNDLYPFTLSNNVIDKLRFVHEVINSVRRGNTNNTSQNPAA